MKIELNEEALGVGVVICIAIVLVVAMLTKSCPCDSQKTPPAKNTVEKP